MQPTPCGFRVFQVGGSATQLVLESIFTTRPLALRKVGTAVGLRAGWYLAVSVKDYEHVPVVKS